jgi:hypothetical protein
VAILAAALLLGAAAAFFASFGQREAETAFGMAMDCLFGPGNRSRGRLEYGSLDKTLSVSDLRFRPQGQAEQIGLTGIVEIVVLGPARPRDAACLLAGLGRPGDRLAQAVALSDPRFDLAGKLPGAFPGTPAASRQKIGLVTVTDLSLSGQDVFPAGLLPANWPMAVFGSIEFGDLDIDVEMDGFISLSAKLASLELPNASQSSRPAGMDGPAGFDWLGNDLQKARNYLSRLNFDSISLNNADIFLELQASPNYRLHDPVQISSHLSHVKITDLDSPSLGSLAIGGFSLDQASVSASRDQPRAGQDLLPVRMISLGLFEAQGLDVGSQARAPAGLAHGPFAAGLLRLPFGLRSVQVADLRLDLSDGLSVSLGRASLAGPSEAGRIPLAKSQSLEEFSVTLPESSDDGDLAAPIARAGLVGQRSFTLSNSASQTHDPATGTLAINGSQFLAVDGLLGLWGSAALAVRGGPAAGPAPPPLGPDWPPGDGLRLAGRSLDLSLLGIVDRLVGAVARETDPSPERVRGHARAGQAIAAGLAGDYFPSKELARQLAMPLDGTGTLSLRARPESPMGPTGLSLGDPTSLSALSLSVNGQPEIRMSPAQASPQWPEGPDPGDGLAGAGWPAGEAPMAPSPIPGTARGAGAGRLATWAPVGPGPWGPLSGGPGPNRPGATLPADRGPLLAARRPGGQDAASPCLAGPASGFLEAP